MINFFSQIVEQEKTHLYSKRPFTSLFFINLRALVEVGIARECQNLNTLEKIPRLIGIVKSLCDSPSIISFLIRSSVLAIYDNLISASEITKLIVPETQVLLREQDKLPDYVKNECATEITTFQRQLNKVLN